MISAQVKFCTLEEISNVLLEWEELLLFIVGVIQSFFNHVIDLAGT